MALAESRTQPRRATGLAAEWLQNVNPAAALVAVVARHHAGDRHGFVLVQIFALVVHSRHDRAQPDVPCRLWRDGEPRADDDRGFRRLYGRDLRRERRAGGNIGWPWWLAVPIALVLAMIFGAIVGALAVRTEGIYTIMITLAIAAAFFYFTNQNYAIFNGHTGINGIPTPPVSRRRLAGAIPFYYLTLVRRRPLLVGRHLARRARRSGSRCRASATTRAAWRRSASTSTPIASRPMCSRR